MIAWHKADITRQYMQTGPFKIPLPRYYRDKIYTPEEVANYKLTLPESDPIQHQTFLAARNHSETVKNAIRIYKNN